MHLQFYSLVQICCMSGIFHPEKLAVMKFYTLTISAANVLNPLIFIFITFIFIGFTYIGRVSIWITTLLIAREFIITGLRGLAGNQGIMIPPSKFGKAKASLQFWAIGFVMMDFSLRILSFSIADLFVLHALIFSYISGYQYLLGYLKQSK